MNGDMIMRKDTDMMIEREEERQKQKKNKEVDRNTMI